MTVRDIDGICHLKADKEALMCYLGWIYEENADIGSSAKNYVSNVVTAKSRIGRTVVLSSLPILAMYASKKTDQERKGLM